MMPVLLDTGPIVALLDRAQQDHEKCAEALTALNAPLVICEPVISEACHLLRKLPGASGDVLRNIESGSFLISYGVHGRAARLAKLLKKYANVPMEFADACLVDLAEQLGTGRIFTLDADFRAYRWSRNRPFQLLLGAAQ